ncbi:MAG: primosomal protein N' [Candidatus Moraniibacteriota bacterium]|jgi:primosomal protein N' (replication factor Y) (superfamily II helicase)
MQKNDTKYLISVAPLTRISLAKDQSFFYIYESELSVGTLVEVPIGRRRVEGVVTKCSMDFPRESNFQLRRISKVIEKDFLTEEQLGLAEFISSYYLSPIGVVLKHFLPKRVQMRGSIVHKKIKQKKIVTSPEQEEIITQILECSTKKSTQYFLHITNPTDKFSILFSLIQKIIQNTDGQILYLLPELMQTPYFTAFIYHFFKSEEIAVMHSKLGKGEFYKKWRDIKSGKIKLIIGTRIALFAPFKDLKLVVVDEAHDMSHKQWEHNPLFDARTTSKALAKEFTCPHILTSATPRTVDYYHKDNPKTDTEFISFVKSNKPTIEVIDMKKERWDKNKSPLSRELMSRLRFALKDKKQSLLFVNRQGVSAFSVCSKCRTVSKCPTCTRALVNTDAREYKCLHCNYTQKTSAKCSSCKAPIEHIGIGTQRIQRELKKLFPKANVVIADSSTMKKSGAHNKLYKDFSDGKIDIVIGSQMITKGWSSSNIAVSAIIDMDHLLSMPSYDVNEKAFSFIVQMAMRVGKGKLIVQTFQPEDPTVQYASKYNFEEFYDDELGLRKILKYPPYIKLVKLMYQDITKKEVEKIVDDKHVELTELCKDDKNIILSEPYQPLVNKVRNKYRKQIIIKIKGDVLSVTLTNFLVTQNTKWTIDIDPVNTV